MVVEKIVVAAAAAAAAIAAPAAVLVLTSPHGWTLYKYSVVELRSARY